MIFFNVFSELVRDRCPILSISSSEKTYFCIWTGRQKLNLLSCCLFLFVSKTKCFFCRSGFIFWQSHWRVLHWPEEEQNNFWNRTTGSHTQKRQLLGAQVAAKRGNTYLDANVVYGCLYVRPRELDECFLLLCQLQSSVAAGTTRTARTRCTTTCTQDALRTLRRHKTEHTTHCSVADSLINQRKDPFWLFSWVSFGISSMTAESLVRFSVKLKKQSNFGQSAASCVNYACMLLCFQQFKSSSNCVVLIYG